MLLLDLFCGEGGCSMGYHLAGFDVIGVDNERKPRYPFPFIQADALSLSPMFLAQFDAIAASPPCKVHTRMKAFSAKHHLDLIPQTRDLLRATGKPYVIENVEGAPLLDPLILCGSMFGLHVQRHRLFEANFPLFAPACDHEAQRAASPGFATARYHAGKFVRPSPVVTIYGRGNGYGPGETALWREVMGMPWASKDGMAQAIPPVYTRFIGEQLLAYLEARP